MLPQLTVTLPVVHVKPVIKNWLKDIYVWSPEIEARCFTPEGHIHPCLCLEDEEEIQACLECKIACDSDPEVMRSFLLDLLMRGYLPEPDEIYIDHLETMGLIRKRGKFVQAEPLLRTWPVPHLLKLLPQQ